MQEMQMDIKSQIFDRIKPVLMMMNTTFEYFPTLVDEWKNRLLQWNGKMETGSQEASLFEEWLSQLWYLPSKEANTSSIFYSPSYIFKAITSDFDDAACRKYNNMTCVQFAWKAFEKAVRHLIVNYGSIPSWGIDIHEIRFDHDVLSSVSLLKCVSCRGVYGSGGTSTLNVSPTYGK
jgi:acyl-homoserine lactone acylase PvdQ